MRSMWVPLGACAIGVAMFDCRAPTEILLEVSTDADCKQVRGTEIIVGGPTNVDTRPSAASTTVCRSGRIGSLVITPSSSDEDDVAIKVVTGVGQDPKSCMGGGEGCIVARREIRFVPNTTLTIPIVMRQSCVGVKCAAGETCVDGKCASDKCGQGLDCSKPNPIVDAGDSDGSLTSDAAGDAPVDAGPDLYVEAGPPPTSCAAPLSCDNNHSCCESLQIVGGEKNRMGSGLSDEVAVHDNFVTSFYLDRFEVTVGRFKKFVAAYGGAGTKPQPNDGAHPKIANSGWNAAWDAFLPATSGDWANRLTNGCNGGLPTYAAGRDNRPINCLTWYEAFAFCIWDKGRLPTESEWEYAAAGGAQNRDYPWGSLQILLAALQHPNYACTGSILDGNCTINDILQVGDRKNLNGGHDDVARWGNEDMGGNVAEWTLDLYTNPYSCKGEPDCAAVGVGVVDGGSAQRTARGAHWRTADTAIGDARAANRNAFAADRRDDTLGLRCAR